MSDKLASGKMILTGNKAAAYGFALAKLNVFGGYPITPSTEVTEEIAAMASSGLISTTYRNTDSELASMALGIGVATAGGRYGTATSSQGLALMFDLLHWATTSQLPMVIVNVNRSLGAPWSIHPDQTDSLLFRDLFMPQIYCASVQEALDMVLWAYRLSEDRRVSLPVLVCFDGFMISHTAEIVTVPKSKLVCEFLPENISRENSTLQKFSEKKIVNLQCPNNWREHSRRKMALVSAMRSARDIIPKIATEWRRIFGKSVKVIGLRFFRPFPAKALRNAIGNASKIIVIDRSILPNGHGVLADELRFNSGAYGYNNADIYSFVGGFGGQNLSEKSFLNVLCQVLNEIRPLHKTYWMGDIQ